MWWTSFKKTWFTISSLTLIIVGEELIILFLTAITWIDGLSLFLPFIGFLIIKTLVSPHVSYELSTAQFVMLFNTTTTILKEYMIVLSIIFNENRFLYILCVIIFLHLLLKYYMIITTEENIIIVSLFPYPGMEAYDYDTIQRLTELGFSIDAN